MSDQPPAKSEHEQRVLLELLDMLDRLRDGINLQIECAMRDIRREMEKEGK